MKQIVFYPTSKEAELVVPKPKPASSYLPEWYRKTRSLQDNEKIFENGNLKSLTIKSCMPFFDAVTSGYIQETWCDLQIVERKNDVEFHFAHGPTIISARNTINMPHNDYFLNYEFIWHMPWLPKVESGYSCLFTHPFNNFQLPFTSLTGIIDSDIYYCHDSNAKPSANYPFYLHKNSDGFIPAGTPMYQIIPLKRDNWKSSSSNFDKEKIFKNYYPYRKVFWGAYKKIAHNKKSYQ
jgi:hypothetical protein